MGKNDGGSAFPTEPETEVFYTEFGPDERSTGNGPGMSLRDWFAGMALEGSKWSTWSTGVEGERDMPADVSSACYHIADCMLKERGE